MSTGTEEQEKAGRSGKSRGLELDVSDVTLYRGTEVTLSVPSLEIEGGSLTAVLGISGSGKTTFIECLAGTLRPQTGTIRVDGELLSERYSQYQREMAYVPQEHIVHGEITVDQALHYASVLRLGGEGSREEKKEEREDLLYRLRLDGVRDHPVSHLSGGQKKRVSVATEMVSNPRLLLLDEPTAGLDPGHHQEFMEMLREVADEGCTVIMTTHHTELLELCDEVVLINNGEVADQDTPERILETHNCRSYGELFSSFLAAADREEREVEEKTLLDSLLVPVYPLYLLVRTLLFWGFILIRDFVRVLYGALRALITRPVSSVVRTARHLLPRLFSLLSREQTILFRHRAFLSYLLLLPLIIGVLIGVVGEVHTQPRRTVFLALVASFWLGINTSTLCIIREISIFQKERLASPYKETYVVSYLGSKLVWYGSLGLLAGLLLVGGIMLMGSFHFTPFGRPERLLLTIGIIEISSFLGVLLGLLISAVSENEVFAMALVPLLVLPGLLLSRVVLNKPLHQPVGTPEVTEVNTGEADDDSRTASEQSNQVPSVSRQPFEDELLPTVWYWTYRIHPVSFLYEGAPLTLRLEPGRHREQIRMYLWHLTWRTLLPAGIMGFLFFFLSHLVLLFRARIGIAGL